jgi:hypothetical protein
MSTDTSPAPLQQAINGVKLAGDFAVLPGSSLLLDGKVLEGGAHAIIGLVAVRAIGPVGWFLTAANAYSKSTSGSSLVEHFSGLVNRKKAKKAEAEAGSAPASSGETA